MNRLTSFQSTLAAVRNVTTLLLAMLLVCFATAQSIATNGQAQESTPVIKTKVQYVLIPVLVHDKKHQHVGGLTKDDFEISENGKDQTISSFEEVQTDAAPVKVYTNEISGAQSKKRIVIIVIDNINTPLQEQQTAREQVFKFLAAGLKDNVLVEILSINISGVRVMHDFTHDTKVLIDTLKNSKMQLGTADFINLDTLNAPPEVGQGSLSSGFSSTDNFISMDTGQYNNLQQTTAITATTEAFRDIAEAFTGIPGHKSLLWVTVGIPFQVTPDPQSFRTAKDPIDILRYQLMMKRLNDADISVYPLDARGMFFVGQNDATYGANRTNIDNATDLQNSLKEFADQTGGEAYVNNNDIAGALDRATQDATSYYLISYPLNKSTVKIGWNRLNVKLKRSGVDVRSRKGFYYYVSKQDKDKDVDRDKDIKLGMLSPVDFTSIVVRAKFGAITSGDGGKKNVAFQILLPPTSTTVDEDNNNHFFMDFAYSVRDTKGNQVDAKDFTFDMNLKPDQKQILLQEGINVDKALSVPPGVYSVHFVARDNISGRTGSLIVPLKVDK